MKIRRLLSLGVVLAPLVAQEPATREPAATATVAWQRGDFTTAQAEFARAAAASPAPGPLLYNAGVCAQRQREFARARWFWLRAEPCMPRDVDLQACLREVEEVVGSADWTRPASGPLRWLAPLHHAELLWLTIALQSLGWAGHFLGRARFWRWLGRASLATGLLLAAGLIWQQWGRADRAVVAADDLVVRAAPAEAAAATFKLRAGELVELGPPAGPWRAVHHPRGRGFVSTAGLLVID